MTFDSRLESAGLPDHEPDVDRAWNVVSHRGRRGRAIRRGSLVAAVLAIVAVAAGSFVLRSDSDRLDVAADSRSEDDATGTWTPIPDAPLPPRQPGVAVWTGREMVIGGGDTADPCGLNADCVVEPVPQRDGAAYDPETKTWRTIEDAPVAFTGGTGVWTGDHVLVLATTPGTSGPLPVMLAYDPTSDSWSRRATPPTDDLGEPAWTGEQWVFPSPQTISGSGGWSYLPTEDRWEALEPDTIGPASERSLVAADGSLFLFASVYDQPDAPTNGLYQVAQFDIEARKWRTLEVPEVANNGSTWTSTGEFVVNPTPSATNAEPGQKPIPYGAVLDVRSGDMRPLPDPPPLENQGPRTGYFGDAGGWVVADTRLFDPASDTWVEIAPRPAGVHPGATVWTGDALITWGGFTESDGTRLSDAGHAYQPPPLPGSEATPTTGVSDPNESPESPQPGEDAVVVNVADGAWMGARTSADGRSLTVAFVGAREFDGSDPCSVRYTATATESPEEVRLRVVGESPGVVGESAGDEDARTCTLKGHLRKVTVALIDPLAERALRVAPGGERREVFDGSTLASPGWLPNGWELLAESRGYLEPASAASWSRTWGPPGTNAVDACPAADSTPIGLTQGPPEILQPAPSDGGRDAATFDVRGNEAVYVLDHVNMTGRLQWVETGQAFVVTTRPSCADDTLTPAEDLVRFAQELQVAP